MVTYWQSPDERENTMNCQEMEELLGSYVLEALGEEERRVADAHLAECQKCAHTVQQLRSIVDLFPLSVPAVDPPPLLKTRILARIQEESTRQYPGMVSTSPSAPARTDRRNWSTAVLVAILCCLFLLVGASLLWNLSLRQQIAQLSAHPEPPVVYVIHGTSTATDAKGELTYYVQQDITVLVVQGLPQLRGTQVYQGWLLQGNKPTSIGLLNVEQGIATLGFQGNISRYSAAAVSLEPGPQASNGAPRGPIVALGALKGS